MSGCRTALYPATDYRAGYIEQLTGQVALVSNRRRHHVVPIGAYSFDFVCLFVVCSAECRV